MRYTDKSREEIFEKMRVFHDFLTGEKTPDGVSCETPKLTPKGAYAVIWFLQEICRVIPDNTEFCTECESLFDSDFGSVFCLSDEEDCEEEGFTTDAIGKKLCGDCAMRYRKDEE